MPARVDQGCFNKVFLTPELLWILSTSVSGNVKLPTVVQQRVPPLEWCMLSALTGAIVGKVSEGRRSLFLRLTFPALEKPFCLMKT